MSGKGRKVVTEYPRSECYFCGSEGPIESHHIVPRRYGGIDDEINLVDLCSKCHERLESIYGKRFYDQVGASETEKNSYLPAKVLNDIANKAFELRIDEGLEVAESQKQLLNWLIDEYDLDQQVCEGCNMIATPLEESRNGKVCKHCGHKMGQQS